MLLFRSYLESRLRILLWSALCFVCLTANNVLLFVDLVMLPDGGRPAGRAATPRRWSGMLFLLYGFIRESE